MALRHVDPNRRRGLVYRSWAWVLGTRPVLWVARRIGWRLDPILLRLTGGRIGSGLTLQTAVLETVGARSGELRRKAVVYFHDGDDVVLMAAKAGAPEHPAWFHNIRANPSIRLNGDPFFARVVTDEDERSRLWTLADRIYPGYAAFRASAARAGRTIPLLRLTPMEGSSPNGSTVAGDPSH